MEQTGDQQKQNKTITALSLSQNLLLTKLREKRFEEIEGILPKTIEGALNEEPIAMLQKKVFKEDLENFMAFELTKLAGMINVDQRLNLTPQQILFLAESLVEMYPTENLADFVICFKRGALGKFGPVYRLDGVVVNEWIEKYLDEKYQIRENRHETESKAIASNEVNTGSTIDWVKKWCELTGYNPIVKENESKRPKKVSLAAGIPMGTPEYYEQQEMRRQWMLENTDKQTGKITGLEFSDWLELQSKPK